MNQLKTNAGGQPLRIDDLTFMQSAFKDGLKALLNGFADTAHKGIILWGCGSTINAPNLDIDAGAIYIDGEIYNVDAHSIAYDSNDTHYWSIATTATQRIFADQTTHDVKEVRKAEVLGSTSPPANYVPLNAPQYSNVVNNNLATAWQDAPASGLNIRPGAIHTLTIDASNTSIRYKQVGKTMWVNFSIRGTLSGGPGGTPTGLLWFNLPNSGVAKTGFDLSKPVFYNLPNAGVTIKSGSYGLALLEVYSANRATIQVSMDSAYDNGDSFKVWGQFVVELE